MTLSRRDIFRGLVDPSFWQRRRGRVPLPYLRDRDASRSVCTACAVRSGVDAGPPCMAACPEGIVGLADDGAPYLHFERSGCTFCGDCAAACEPKVLDSTRSRTIAAAIELNRGACLAWSQTMCQSCADRCPDRAIVFGARLMEPVIDLERCTRCGLCVTACPTEAIALSATMRSDGS